MSSSSDRVNSKGTYRTPFSVRALSDYKGTYRRSSPSLNVVGGQSVSYFAGLGGVLRVLLIAALLILFASVVANLTGDNPKTFASFLEMLQSAPAIGTEWLSFESVSVSLPDWLDWLAPFVRFVEGFIRVGGFIVTGLIQALTFILHFLTWVFV